jgi:xanthine/CO dehydrogenase XdhC/CoxF family maturation factor
MHPAHGILLDLTADSAIAEAAAPDRAGLVTVITARCLTKPAPAAALLVRPDGHVAWAAGPGTPDPATGMNEALRTWFSPHVSRHDTSMAGPESMTNSHERSRLRTGRACATTPAG